MERRVFLELLTMAAATAAFDPERLLWVPGEKKIFIPSVALSLGRLNRITDYPASDLICREIDLLSGVAYNRRSDADGDWAGIKRLPAWSLGEVTFATRLRIYYLPTDPNRLLCQQFSNNGFR